MKDSAMKRPLLLGAFIFLLFELVFEHALYGADYIWWEAETTAQTNFPRTSWVSGEKFGARRRDLFSNGDWLTNFGEREGEETYAAYNVVVPDAGEYSLWARKYWKHGPFRWRFNDSDWRGDLLKDDKRWAYGTPPAANANYAWVQHFIHHLAPTGLAGFVLANGSMSSNQSGEGEIRKAIVEADLVDCMVALPGQLFYSTQIPVCLWFLARSKSNGRFRDRRGETLFIDARKLGTMADRTHRELTDADIAKIAGTYHAWRGDADAGEYADVPGFCMAASLEDIRKHGHVLTPGRYVGAEVVKDDGEPFEEKMKRLTATLREQQAEAAALDKQIARNLAELGFWSEET